MAQRLADGSIQMSDGRVVYANSLIQAQDLLEILPLVTPPPAWPFISGGGGGGGSGTPGARGADGAPGAPGAPGAQGPQGTNPGFQGTQGRQGAQGTLGPQGDAGLNGAQGRQGPQGNQGGSGAQGLQGFQGVNGSQGSNPAASSSVLVRRSTNQVNGGSPAVLNWESADINNGPMWVIGSPSLISILVPGFYRAYFCIPVDDGGFGGAIVLRKNGVTVLAEQRGTIAPTGFGGSAPFLVATWGPFPMAAGEYFEFLTSGLSGAGPHTVVAIGGLNPFAEVERVF